MRIHERLRAEIPARCNVLVIILIYFFARLANRNRKDGGRLLIGQQEGFERGRRLLLGEQEEFEAVVVCC